MWCTFRGQRSALDVFLSHSPPYFVSQGLLLILEIQPLVRLAQPGQFRFWHLALRLQTRPSAPTFYVTDGDSALGPHARAASPSPSESSPQPLRQTPNCDPLENQNTNCILHSIQQPKLNTSISKAGNQRRTEAQKE